MSKLESAFSKALEKQKSLESASFDGAGGSPLNDRQLLVSSRKQIAGMLQQKVFSEAELAARRIVYPGMRDSKLLNIYRNVRTKLIAAGGQSNFVTLVTSVVPKGGSSLVAANIAASFAFDEGKTAILIDGNIHSPALKDLFDLKDGQASGIVDYLEADNLTIDQVIYETGIPRLRFVPAGSYRENSTEYLASLRMREFISEVVQRYPERFPIIDTPSVLESADTRILIDLCDQVVLVVPYGQCTEADIRAAALTVGKGKLAGVILNQF